MRLLFWFSFLFPLTLAPQNTQQLTIDPAASTLTWTGHAEVGTYAPSGGLSIQEGRIRLRDGSFAGATLKVDMKSMTQSNADLLHHLKSSDFFDVDHYPTALIQIDRVANSTVYGTMTVKGKSAPLQAPVKTAQLNGRFLITGKTTLDRTQYGITYNSTSFFSSLGDKAIRNTFEVEFALAGAGTLPNNIGHSQP